MTGAGALSEGMIQFNEDGIKKLVSAFDGDISGMLDKLNGMLDASKEYKNFAGIFGRHGRRSEVRICHREIIVRRRQDARGIILDFPGIFCA